MDTIKYYFVYTFCQCVAFWSFFSSFEYRKNDTKKLKLNDCFGIISFFPIVRAVKQKTKKNNEKKTLTILTRNIWHLCCDVYLLIIMIFFFGCVDRWHNSCVLWFS